jgi:malonyl CoA-acyl carrier protein transacylase
MRCALAEAGAGTTFVEAGPGTVLAGLLRRISKETTAVSLGTAKQLTGFLEQHG